MALEPVRIGAFLALSGPAAYLGEPELKVLQLYISRINAEGGVLGREIQLIHYDTGGRAGEARKAVRTLVHDSKVHVLIGGTTSGASMAVIPLIQRARTPFISLAGSSAIVEPVKSWVFKTPHTDKMAVARVFNELRARRLHRVALISGRGGFGKSGRRQALDQAAEYKIAIVADENYEPGDTNIQRQLQRIAALPHVDAVFNIGFGEGPAMVTRQLRAVDPETPLYQSHGVASQQFITLAGDAAEGVRLPAAGLLVADQLPEGSPQRDVMRLLQQVYRERYGSDVSTFGGHAYDALMLAVQALRDAQTLNPFAVRHALERIRGYTGTGGEVNMTPKDHLGLSPEALQMLEIRNGRWVLLD
ncbi:MAG: ABC transporter substrate-binding protein [Marinobacterium sp.]|nr:ABC transporter substrate-binding protein [Marinobacterium sp.]